MTNAGTARDWLVAGPRPAGRSPTTSSPSRPTRKVSPTSASTPRTCSASGTGSAGRYSMDRRDRAVHDARRSARSTSPTCLPGSTRSTSTSRTAPLEQNLPVLMGLLRCGTATSCGAATQAVLPYDNYLRALPGLPAAADDGEQRQVGHPRRARRCTATTGADRVGRARHQRPARVLPAAAPGHRGWCPADFIGFARPADDRSGTTTRARGERARAARVLAFGRTAEEVAAEGVAPELVAAQGDAGQPPLDDAAAREADAVRRSARSSPCTSTACSPPAWSGGSTPSTSGASSWAR